MHNSAAHSLRKIIRNNYTNVFFFIFTTIPTRDDVTQCLFIYLFIHLHCTWQERMIRQRLSPTELSKL